MRPPDGGKLGALAGTTVPARVLDTGGFHASRGDLPSRPHLNRLGRVAHHRRVAMTASRMAGGGGAARAPSGLLFGRPEGAARASRTLAGW